MAKTKVRKPSTGHCERCALARLMQWSNNPIIAECSITKERWVAVAGCPSCSFYKETSMEIPIEHFTVKNEVDNT